jgi:hypothetical protein
LAFEETARLGSVSDLLARITGINRPGFQIPGRYGTQAENGALRYLNSHQNSGSCTNPSIAFYANRC